MDSKKVIILFLGLVAMVLLLSLGVSARIFTELSSNTKIESVEKLNGGYNGVLMNGGYDDVVRTNLDSLPNVGGTFDDYPMNGENNNVGGYMNGENINVGGYPRNGENNYVGGLPGIGGNNNLGRIFGSVFGSILPGYPVNGGNNDVGGFFGGKPKDNTRN